MYEITKKGNHYILIIDGEEYAECDSVEECKKEYENVRNYN